MKTLARMLVAAAVLLAFAALFAALPLEPMQAPVAEVKAPTAQPTQPASSGLPSSVQVPAMGLDEKLVPVGLKADGAMETPPFGEVGWYAPGVRPGDPGPAVIVAHVHRPGADDVFADLHTLRRGDRVTVRRARGSVTFVVDRVEQLPKEQLPVDRIWSDGNAPTLRLITCAGAPDAVTGVYPDNTIVYANAL